jgi:hypothetical protein
MTPDKTENIEQIFEVPGSLKRSGEILTLKDLTTGRPCFKLFPHFTKWIREHNPKTQTLQLFYTGATIKAYDKQDLAEYTRDTREQARMDFELHPVLVRLKHGLGVRFEQDDFEEWISSLSRYLDNDARLLLVKVRDLQLTKKLQIEKKKSNTGFKLLIAMDDDNSDFVPPDTVTMTVPIFKGMEARGTFQMEFQFGFDMVGAESCKTYWKLECHTWEEDLLDVTSQVIENSLAEADLASIPVFAGSIELTERDDKWSILHNGENGITRA